MGNIGKIGTNGYPGNVQVRETCPSPEIPASSDRRNLERITEEEKEVRDEVTRLPDEELRREYKRVVVGQEAYLGSVRGGRHRITNLREEFGECSPVHCMAYGQACHTYLAASDALQNGITRLKVREDSRHSKQVDTEKVLLDAIRRMAILDEYEKRTKAHAFS